MWDSLADGTGGPCSKMATELRRSSVPPATARAQAQQAPGVASRALGDGGGGGGGFGGGGWGGNGMMAVRAAVVAVVAVLVQVAVPVAAEVVAVVSVVAMVTAVAVRLLWCWWVSGVLHDSIGRSGPGPGARAHARSRDRRVRPVRAAPCCRMRRPMADLGPARPIRRREGRDPPCVGCRGRGRGGTTGASDPNAAGQQKGERKTWCCHARSGASRAKRKLLGEIRTPDGRFRVSSANR